MSNSASTKQIVDWLTSFEDALNKYDYSVIVELFATDCFWRDLLSFTWNIKTSEGKEEIEKMLRFTLPETKPTNWMIEGEATNSSEDVNEAFFTFETFNFSMFFEWF